MGKRRKKRRSEKAREGPQNAAKPTVPFNNPFAALSGVRDQLPRKEPSAPPPEREQPPRPEESRLGTCGKLVVQREKKGRAGKTVTRIAGLPKERIDVLAKQLKSALGCGATREGDDLLLLGSLVDRAVQWLEGEGARQVVVSGAAHETSQAKRSRPSETPQRHPSGPRSWREATRRDDLEAGLTVDIVLKRDQTTGRLTRGVIRDILTRSPTHPHGIKVRLEDGSVGRVKLVVGEP